MKKGWAKTAAVLLAGAMCFGVCGCNVVGDTKDKDKDLDAVEKGDYTQYTKLVIDGGGQNAAYNSTPVLEYDKYENPYPYNTLERLVEQWNKDHAAEYGYYFTVATTSLNNDRTTMVPMLSQGTAPEIVYYLGTTIAEDQSKGYFYDLNDVMEGPNKYAKEGETGSVRWRDVYPDDLYRSFFSPDGQIFTVNLEQNPIGLIYNKTLFQEAGITELPETFKEFMEVQDRLNAYAKTVNRANPDNDATYLCPFYHRYRWYDLVLETTVMSDVIPDLDVIRPDGRVDGEEFARGFYINTDGELVSSSENKTRLYSPDDDCHLELYRLIKEKSKYYPTNTGYIAEDQFLDGNVAMLEATGNIMRKLYDGVDGEFEVGVMPFPNLTTQPADEEANGYYTTYNVGGYSVQRGLSGYSTGWAISNSAMNRDKQNGNSKCVDACIDMLMYLSCAENNDKMVNDRGFAIPLSGNTTVDLFKPLAEVFKEDRKNPKALAWAAAAPSTCMNSDFYNASEHFLTDLMVSTRPLKDQAQTLVSAFQTTVSQLAEPNGWTPREWATYGKENA